MGRGKSPKDVMLEWIEDIPDHKLEGGVPSGAIYKDVDMRLDNQCITTARPGYPACYNLQVQVNKGCRFKTVKTLVPKTVAWLLVPCHEQWTARQIKDALKQTVTGGLIRPPRV